MNSSTQLHVLVQPAGPRTVHPLLVAECPPALAEFMLRTLSR